MSKNNNPSNQNQKDNSVEVMVYNSLTDEQKAAVAKAFVEKRQAEARASEAQADNVEAAVTFQTKDTERTVAETKKLKISIVLGILGAVGGAIFGGAAFAQPFMLAEKYNRHHDKTELRYSDDERDAERAIKQNSMLSMKNIFR